MAVKIPDDFDLAAMLKQIEGIRSSQVGGIQALGSSQDQNIQNIYSNLRGGLQGGVSTTQNIYNTGMQNVRNAYAQGGDQALGAASMSSGGIQDFASRLGMDSDALRSVQGQLGLQAGQYDQSNRNSMMNRLASMAQQGAGQTAIAQLGVDASRNTESQARQGLSDRILSEIAKANSGAASSRAGATTTAASNAARAAMSAQSDVESTQAELLREQRAIAREERSAEKDPLSQIMKALQIQKLQGELNPDDPDNLLKMLNLDERQSEFNDRNSETMIDIFDDIRRRFPNGGNRTIPLLQAAIRKNEEEDDPTGGTAQDYVTQHAGNLDLRAVLEQLSRLQRAAQAASRSRR